MYVGLISGETLMMICGDVCGLHFRKDFDDDLCGDVCGASSQERL